MPKVRPLTEAGRAAARNEARDNSFRAAIGAWCAVHGGHKAMAAAAGIPYRTLMKRLESPKTLGVDELRRINDVLPTGGKVPAEVIGA